MAARRNAPRRGPQTAKPVRQTLAILRLAHQGDGVAETEKGAVYIPGTLPGETVEADVAGERGQLVRVLHPAAERVAAPCPHFLVCGGCTLQHMSEESYDAWKRGQIVHALQSRGIDAPVRPLLRIGAHSRRRASFAAERVRGQLRFGFHSARSHTVVAIEECPVLAPELLGALAGLRALAAIAAPNRGILKVHCLSSETGLDVRLDDFGAAPDFATERALIDRALKADFARLSLGDDILIETREPVLHFGAACATPAPGGFAQAAAASEATLARLASKALAHAGNILDLFAGSGTFSLRLAEHARIHAVEGDDAALSALKKAIATTSGLKPVTAERRDLFRRPFDAKELQAFDAVLLNPPRAGAQEQMAALAASGPGKIVYISCAPASFARDASVLIAAGYKLDCVTPVDQFLFSHHIESVGVFQREG